MITLIIDVAKKIYEDHVLKNLLHTFSDSIDFVRENAIKLNQEFIEKYKKQEKYI